MTQHQNTKKTTSKVINQNSETYPTLKEMIKDAIVWAKKDYSSCPSVLKRIIDMGLYSTCLICLGAVWMAYSYKCSCELDWDNLKQPKISMVLYQNGRAFISQTQEMELKVGLQNISFGSVPKRLIVPSATVSGEDLSMQSMNFTPASEKHTYFERAQTQAIGQPVTLMWEVWKDGKKTEMTKPAQLLATEYNEPILLVDGKVQKGTDAKILYPTPTKQTNTQPELAFTVFSNTAEPQLVDFSYMASGFEWKAFYNLYLDEEKHSMDIQGQVNLTNNSGVAYKNVSLDFVLGEINTLSYITPTQPDPICEINNRDGIHVASDQMIVNGKLYNPSTGEEARPFGKSYAHDGVANAKYLNADGRYIDGAAPGNDIRDLKDYYVYHVPFPVQLNDKAPTMATFLNGRGLSYHKEYVFTNLIRLGSSQISKNIPPALTLIFNTKNLGLPLPKGDFRVFNKQQDGTTFFVGESHVNKVTMPDQDAKINMGEALDVYADTTLTDHTELSDEEAIYTYEITLRNVSNEDKDVKIAQRLETGRYIFKDASVDPSEVSPVQAKWEIVLPAQTVQKIQFSVLYRNLEWIQHKREMQYKEDLCKNKSPVHVLKVVQEEEE